MWAVAESHLATSSINYNVLYLQGAYSYPLSFSVRWQFWFCDSLCSRFNVVWPSYVNFNLVMWLGAQLTNTFYKFWIWIGRYGGIVFSTRMPSDMLLPTSMPSFVSVFFTLDLWKTSRYPYSRNQRHPFLSIYLHSYVSLLTLKLTAYSSRGYDTNRRAMGETFCLCSSPSDQTWTWFCLHPIFVEGPTLVS
jgi:hypothetical protein